MMKEQGEGKSSGQSQVYICRCAAGKVTSAIVIVFWTGGNM